MAVDRNNLKFSDVAAELGLDPNNPTVEGQQKLKQWLDAHPGYTPGNLTNAYLNQQPTDMPSNQATPPAANTPGTSLLPNHEGVDYTGNQIQQPISTENKLQSKDSSKDNSKEKSGFKEFVKDASSAGQGLNSDALKAWTPLAVGALGGVDRSGEAAGYNAQAQQNYYNAMMNEKLRQRNMQRATDNTLADKVAAAQASGKWKQNANAIGAEGGAQAVAARNEAADLDLWQQEQLHNERADMSAQNLAEVNRNKLMGIGNETNEAMTNYDTNVQDSQNAYKSALANAKENKSNKNEGSENKSDTEDTDKPGDNTSNETNTNTTSSTGISTEAKEDTQPAGTKSVAKSNQESEGTLSATDLMKAGQIRDRTEAMYREAKNAASQGDVDKLKKLVDEYNQLTTDFNSLSKEAQQGGYKQFKFDEFLKEAEDKNKSTPVDNIVSGVTQGSIGTYNPNYIKMTHDALSARPDMVSKGQWPN